MIKAEKTDKQEIIKILSLAFEGNQSVNYIIRQDSKKRKRITALMDYSYEVCSIFGEVWLSDDRKACALLLYPHLKQNNLKSIWLDIKLIFQAIGVSGIKKALNRETQIKKIQSKETMAYLWFIGISPVYQHQGIGSNFLNEIIDDANKKGLPVYLETSTTENLPWYERFSFQIYDQLEFNYTLFFLKREPDIK